MKRSTVIQTKVHSLIVVQFVALLAVAALLFPIVSQAHTTDLHLYFAYSQQFLQGKHPYRDFPMEYPPLALFPFVLPRLMALRLLPLTYENYCWLFLLENGLFSTLIALSLARIVARYQTDRTQTTALLIYLLFILINSALLPWRYDLFPTLLTMLAFLALLEDRPTAVGIWLGLGIMAKIYPVFVVGLFCAYYFTHGHKQAVARLVGSCVTTTIIVLLPFVLLARRNWFSFLTYQQLRGIQIESLPGGIIWLVSALGIKHSGAVYNFGAIHLVSPLADAVLPWQPIVSSLAIVGVLLVCLYHFYQERTAATVLRTQTLAASLIALLLTFIITNKVFSPQYLIWLLPFAPLLRPFQMLLLAIICAISIFIFPFHYNQLLSMDLVPVLLLNLRNALVLALIPWLLFARSSARVENKPQVPLSVVARGTEEPSEFQA